MPQATQNTIVMTLLLMHLFLLCLDHIHFLVAIALVVLCFQESTYKAMFHLLCQFFKKKKKKALRILIPFA